MFGEILSAGANLIGGLLNRNAAKDAAQKQQENFNTNIQMQKDFAQQGIRWRVADAKAAGIHPLFALGSSGASFSPIATTVGADTSMGTALANAGQDVGRAINSTRTQSERVTAVSEAAQKLSLTKMDLENQLLASQIAKLNQTPNPAMPASNDRFLIDGQGNAKVTGVEAPKSLIQEKPMERAPSDPGRPFSEPGAVTDVGYAKTAQGGYAPVPSKDVKERIEDTLIPELLWAIRNNVLPAFGLNEAPPKVPLPPGYDRWKFHPFKFEYRPVRKNPKTGLNQWY